MAKFEVGKEYKSRDGQRTATFVGYFTDSEGEKCAAFYGAICDSGVSSLLKRKEDGSSWLKDKRDFDFVDPFEITDDEAELIIAIHETYTGNGANITRKLVESREWHRLPTSIKIRDLIIKHRESTKQ